LQSLTLFLAVVLCAEVVRTYLINFAKSFRYSTAQPRATLLAVSIVYDFLETAERKARADRMLALSKYMRDKLASIGSRLVVENVPISPIICILCEKPREMSEWLQNRGYSVTPVTFPVVPKGTDRLRVCLHAGNTIHQVDGLVVALQAWGDRAKL
jgi:8-amino-7-oxononanoate synthase